MAEGYVNDYYVVRSFTELPLDGAANSIGKFVRVKVEVYYGGDKLSGTKVQNIDFDKFLYAGYKP